MEGGRKRDAWEEQGENGEKAQTIRRKIEKESCWGRIEQVRDGRTDKTAQRKEKASETFDFFP